MLAKHRRQRTTDRRRGVTLVEMLVTVAVLVILMTILAQIFQAATGSVSAAQAYQQLDDQLRRLDGIIRGDLEGVTARFTPPLDPEQKLGYFEYGENEFADNQGEDGDDYIRFTAKAPPGQPFTGRFWPPSSVNGYGTLANQPLPITITSDYAEIIYFVRNGNLYRRVFLVVPQMQSVILQAVNNQYTQNGNLVPFRTSLLSTNNLSWQGVNDLSAHPTPRLNSTTTIVLNDLGDLTNRENRAFYPRFADDFWSASANGGTGGAGQDGLPDDTNSDNIPDLYPSLYPNVFTTQPTGSLVFTSAYNGVVANATALLGFPYVFPGAYTSPQTLSNNNLGYAPGWIHSPTPSSQDTAGNVYQFDGNSPFAYLNNLNHNPLDQGDNLMPPPGGQMGPKPTGAQTWWGFPTWRETLAGSFGNNPLAGWNDPTVPLFAFGNPGSQPNGLSYNGWPIANGYVNPTSTNLLPPMVSSWTNNGNPVNIPGFRNADQLFSDGLGGGSTMLNPALWALGWEDDLIMTGVRSFDVKAYDNALANYADLGWGDDLRLYAPYVSAPGALYTNLTNVQPPALQSTPPLIAWPPINPTVNPLTPVYGTLSTFAHEGRMPPLTSDLRFDAQYGQATYPLQNNPNYNGNVGDNTPGIVRLRRVWDTWSTEYSRAPATGVGAAASGGFPIGPPLMPPVYPSYPPPYPAPLRGIQIQIRVVDPSNQRIKSLTIRQDFTDKL
jgi:prepilin-type N-terminal cleavage/methylation domain-containing protein